MGLFCLDPKLIAKPKTSYIQTMSQASETILPTNARARSEGYIYNPLIFMRNIVGGKVSDPTTIASVATTGRHLHTSPNDSSACYLVFIRLRSTPEVLNTKTLRAFSIRASLVCGFLPRRSFFCLIKNVPNPLISRSSPSARVSLIKPKSRSTIRVSPRINSGFS
jgi:hypothetical protein